MINKPYSLSYKKFVVIKGSCKLMYVRKTGNTEKPEIR